MVTSVHHFARPVIRSWAKHFRHFSAGSVVYSQSHDSPALTVQRSPMKPFPRSQIRSVPPHIRRPPYADTGRVAFSPLHHSLYIHDTEVSIERMRDAARLARNMLDLACSLAKPGVTTDEIDAQVHEALINANAYPSPLNYEGFPKSICSSINEVICHGIPDTRELKFGDVVSFDVSCYLNGVHGDNCATVIVGDEQARDEIGVDWRGVPYLVNFTNETDEGHFVEARRLIQATREGLYAGIDACRPGGCLTEIGSAIHAVADAYGYGTVEKYRGHGICSEFHCMPFVKHYRNNEKIELVPGMIFTIEPMFTQGTIECEEWSDNWTVVTKDQGMAAQFEHTVLIRDNGVEIITIPG